VGARVVSIMLNRHRIAFVSVILCALSSSFAVQKSDTADQGERLRQYLKIEKEHPALVAFMDFQCPSCQKNWPAIKATLAKHPAVKFYSVNFPLINLHKNAFGAAVAYEVARNTGAEKSTYSALLSGKQNLEAASLNAYLKSHHLPGVVGTPKAAKYEVKVNEQLKFATDLGIKQTPMLVVFDATGKATFLNSVSDLASVLN